MARYAMIQTASKIVVNVIEWDGNTATWKVPTGYEMIEDSKGEAGPGFTWNGTTFTPPPGGVVPGTE
jgi:hypothetical protein